MTAIDSELSVVVLPAAVPLASTTTSCDESNENTTIIVNKPFLLIKLKLCNYIINIDLKTPPINF
ncbi:hypothetical protein PPL_09743 [Heterostelium album PN500]|uniref:Uncharacterized protein n=1 Tax=Heterostelium pallidum (strain ATCC 26659 / Pp 5 / PN500) TaxID=670386 RepID=D3BNP0_HETP5|nr:hypothetical protein PPL_09743 [Heterostelium album PN500]EFA76991.1 hypothetical protein PPL_09743 [Heterostelium album PN500]|eukprot:XP_020429122.1 hypothetical protein PPL_09743 [Heterostelium album PN500]